MAVSVVEVQHQTTVANGPRTVTLATTPAAGDVVLVVYRCHLATGVRSVSTVTGLGATWSLLAQPSVARQQVWKGTGASSSGVVTVTQTSAAPMSLTVYLVRGLASTSITAIPYINGNPGTPVSGSVDAGLGQIVVASVAAYDTSLASYTFTEDAPGSGWVRQTDVNNGTQGINATHRIPAGASATHTVTLDSSTTGDTVDGFILAIGDYTLPNEGVITATAPMPAASATAALTVPAVIAAGPPMPYATAAGSPGGGGR